LLFVLGMIWSGVCALRVLFTSSAFVFTWEWISYWTKGGAVTLNKLKGSFLVGLHFENWNVKKFYVSRIFFCSKYLCCDFVDFNIFF
jgi:hypothetical protein